MAPATTIGASSPVDSSGNDLSATEKAKVESVLVTDITNMQTRYGRNVDLATQMVTKAASYGTTAAVANHIVNLSATSLSDLLNQVNGQTVTLANQQVVTLQTSGASIQEISPSLTDTLYGLLINPNIIFLLFIVAVIGIYVEISHPGAILPGVTGSIALLLFLFGVGSLTPNWAGLALMVLSFVLLVLDVRLTTHGALTIGAVISMIVGALLFFNTGGAYQRQGVNPLEVYITGGLMGCLGLFIVAVIIRVKRKPVKTGKEGMLGALVIARTPLTPGGRVSFGGEDWAAVLDPPTLSVDNGAELRITAVEGLRLHVQLATQFITHANSHA
jgi:membrane-bound serine protease (ClpP class)